MEEVKFSGEPRPDQTPLIKNLTIVASGLTAASIGINLILQIAHFARKRPMEPDQRDKIQTASLALTVLRTMPGLIKQVRLFVSQVKRAS